MVALQDTDTSLHEPPTTNWYSLIVASFVTFLCSIQLAIYMNVVWPFLRQLDPDTTETYFGFVSTLSCLCLAISCLGYGYMVKKLGKSRFPLLIGVSIMIIGNLLFLSASFLPGGKFIILFARMVISSGDGVSSVFRNYFVMGSTETDRSRALSLSLVATYLGNAAGSALPALFSFLNYPGIHFTGQLYLNIYTAPSLCCLLGNFVVVGLLLTLFQEANVGGKPSSIETTNDQEIESQPFFDKVALGICLFTQFSQMLMIANVETIYPPFSITMFNWTNQESLTNLSYITSSAFVVSFVLLIFYLVFDKKNRFNHGILVIVGGACAFVFHMLTFSWWFLPGEMTYQTNTTEFGGCRAEFEWCKDVQPVHVWLFAASHVIFNGLSLTIVTISMNTVFTKLIGQHNQGFMLGLLLTVGFVASTVSPITLTSLFERFGPRPVWAIEILSTGTCTLLWIIFYRRLVPLKDTN